MSVVPSYVLANRASARVHQTRTRQREELRNASPQEFVRLLVDPPAELASYRLESLLVPWDSSVRPIKAFGPSKFRRALTSLRQGGCEWADPRARLRQLSMHQRRRLAAAILDTAPKAWREAA